MNPSPAWYCLNSRLPATDASASYAELKGTVLNVIVEKAVPLVGSSLCSWPVSGTAQCAGHYGQAAERYGQSSDVNYRLPEAGPQRGRLLHHGERQDVRSHGWQGRQFCRACWSHGDARRPHGKAAGGRGSQEGSGRKDGSWQQSLCGFSGYRSEARQRDLLAIITRPLDKPQHNLIVG